MGTLSESYFLKQYRTATLKGAVERAAHKERAALFDGWSSIPVDIGRIASLRGLREAQELSGSACREGRLVPVSGGFLVQLRSSSSAARRRFSLAHEIGHSIFYRNDGARPSHEIGILSFDEMSAEERICNLFAGALLMPVGRLRDQLSCMPRGDPAAVLTTLERTAQRFQVSLRALVERLSSVQPETSPYVVIYLRFRENQVSNVDPRLRVDACCALGPNRRLWIWRNRSAEGVNLKSCAALFDAWKAHLAGPLDADGGRYTWSPETGLVSAAKSGLPCTSEEVNVSTLRRGKWSEETLPVTAASCLYVPRNASERQACLLSVLAPSP
jgi:hypothetical protein